MRAAFPIRFRATDDLASDRRDFSDTKEHEANKIHGGIAFRPFEVDVRQTVGLVPHGQQEGRQRVRNG